jgi:hypothetical protein
MAELLGRKSIPLERSASGWIPGGVSQAYSGQDVQFDALHKLFLIGQPLSSHALSGSSILVYDVHGNFVKSIDGLSLPSGRSRLALNPRLRIGFVVTAPNLDTLQSFAY